MSKLKMLIDTDPGVDDAMAILFAGLCPDIELVAMTSVFGNLVATKATRNALVLAEMIEHDIPVAQGAEIPLIQTPNQVSDHVHGPEGFGDHPAMHPRAKADPRPAHQMICDIVHAHPNEITLCPIGPLTNIALALQHDPSIAAKTKQVVLMGGSLDAGGNVTKHAEANIWNDPHAADLVFAAPWDVTMVGLDVTDTILCRPEDFSEMANSAPKKGGFLKTASEFYINFYLEKRGLNGCSLHDPAAVIAAAYPHLFEVENHSLEVKVDGEEVGKTIRSNDVSFPKAKVCTGVKANTVKKLFMDTIKSGD